MMMQPQDMHIWEGMELLCYRRKYTPKSPVNGGVYVVHNWDDKTVTVRLHEDYRQNFKQQEPVPVQAEEDDDDATSEPDDFGEDDDEPASKPAKTCIEGKDLIGWYTLSHAQAVRVLRPQHALVYANIQGRTMREKHIAMMDTCNSHFTVRHLIVATSRATHGKYVHLLNDEEEAKVLQKAWGTAPANKF